MTTLELVLTMLAEATATEISKQKAPSTFSENIAVAREGGEAAGIARKAVEEDVYKRQIRYKGCWLRAVKPQLI